MSILWTGSRYEEMLNRVLSLTLFASYVNDLANDINDMLCGVDIHGSNVAILLHADDIVLLNKSPNDAK